MTYVRLNNPGGGNCGFYSFAHGLIAQIIREDEATQGKSKTFDLLWGFLPEKRKKQLQVTKPQELQKKIVAYQFGQYQKKPQEEILLHLSMALREILYRLSMESIHQSVISSLEYIDVVYLGAHAPTEQDIALIKAGKKVCLYKEGDEYKVGYAVRNDSSKRFKSRAISEGVYADLARKERDIQEFKDELDYLHQNNTHFPVPFLRRALLQYLFDRVPEHASIDTPASHFSGLQKHRYYQEFLAAYNGVTQQGSKYETIEEAHFFDTQELLEELYKLKQHYQMPDFLKIKKEQENLYDLRRRQQERLQSSDLMPNLRINIENEIKDIDIKLQQIKPKLIRIEIEEQEACLAMFVLFFYGQAPADIDKNSQPSDDSHIAKTMKQVLSYDYWAVDSDLELLSNAFRVNFHYYRYLQPGRLLGQHHVVTANGATYQPVSLFNDKCDYGVIDIANEGNGHWVTLLPEELMLRHTLQTRLIEQKERQVPAAGVRAQKKLDSLLIDEQKARQELEMSVTAAKSQEDATLLLVEQKERQALLARARAQKKLDSLLIDEQKARQELGMFVTAAKSQQDATLRLVEQQAREELTTRLTEIQKLRDIKSQKEARLDAIKLALTEKIAGIDQHAVPNAHSAAQRLLSHLTQTFNTFIAALKLAKDEVTINELQQQFLVACKKDIDAERTILEKDLNWGQYLTNLMRDILNAVIAVVTLGAVNKFFSPVKSAAEQAVAQMESDLKNKL